MPALSSRATAVAAAAATAVVVACDRVNLRTFDLNLLRVLDALLTAPQVSAAARRLNLSQPATSAALLRLRNALADPLLVRVGNQMALTRLAEELRPKVRRLVADIELTLGTERISIRPRASAASAWPPTTTRSSPSSLRF